MIYYPRMELRMVKRAAPVLDKDGRRPVVWDLFLAMGEDGGSVVGIFLTDKVPGSFKGRASRVLKEERIDPADSRRPNEEEITHYSNTVLAYPRGRMRLSEDDFRRGVRADAGGLLPPPPVKKTPPPIDENAAILTIDPNRRRR